MRSNLIHSSALAGLLCLAGCGGPSNGDVKKMDTPDSSDQCLSHLDQIVQSSRMPPTASELQMCLTSATNLCQGRQQAVLRSDQKAYLPDRIRWACSDVAGVNNNHQDDRGQEYCEYFAVVQLPGQTQSNVLGRADVSKGTQEQLALALTQSQRDALDNDPTQVVGQCVFTSWHQDVPGPVPACEPGSTSCPTIAGLPFTDGIMRMQSTINTASAAQQLIEPCMTTPLQFQNSSDFIRGCLLDYKIFQTEWRKSDPTICTASLRLKECGCNTAASAMLPPSQQPAAIATALVPTPPKDSRQVKLRGFPLGTWSDPNGLPAGCQYVNIGNESTGPSHTIVSCNLTANDVLLGSADLKQSCRVKYGDNVVVQIPIPAAAISCKPPAGATCSAQPWVVTQ
jgi:hypothetical protein